MNKIVVYTVITNGYDSLLDPLKIEQGIDYICFTDSKNLESKYWTIKPLPKWVENVPKHKRQRMLKILPHILFPEYEKSLYVDGNMQIKGGIIDMFNKINGNIIAIPQHPVRNCVYQEAEAVLKLKKDVTEIVKPQIDRYIQEKFPKEFGLFETGIIFREHNSEECKRCMDKWALEVMMGSHRDQLSLTYAMWATGTKVFPLSPQTKKSEMFNTDMKHIAKKVKVQQKNK